MGRLTCIDTLIRARLVMEKTVSLDFIAIGNFGSIERLADTATAILVISPHPDDDVIGMGGTMRLLDGEGAKVFTVYVCDGRSSGTGKNTGSVRRGEALAALRAVRASGAFFLNQTNSGLAGKSSAKVARQLRTINALLKPAEIYMPSPFERHPTHRRVTRIALQALKNAAHAPRLWGYSVWGGVFGLPGTKYVDISRAVPAKKRAIRQHASQTRIKPYDAGILGRNAYEGIFAETHAAHHMAQAETFIDIAFLQTWPGTDILAGAIASSSTQLKRCRL
jgi:N-acetylglucosamine malate deacetylase 1